MDEDAGESEPMRQAYETEPQAEEGPAICDFCRMPISAETVIATVGDHTYTCCTAHCRDALEQTSSVFTEYHGFRRFPPGIDGLDAALPQGIPRNAFVLLAGQAGTRLNALGIELIWRTLTRGEPAVIVTFTEPPISLVQGFLDLKWNVLPALESNRLRFVDCFSTHIDNPDRYRRRLDRWNEHLSGITDPSVTTVTDPGDVREMQSKLDDALEALGMVDRGTVYIDSLTEFGTLVQPVQAYGFIKELRAEVCKGRFVPIFGGAIVTGNGEEFPFDLAYMLDGIIDLTLAEGIVEDTLIRRMRVRKMDGVLAISEWRAYEFTSARGLLTFDPQEEMAAKQAASEEPYTS